MYAYSCIELVQWVLGQLLPAHIQAVADHKSAKVKKDKPSQFTNKDFAIVHHAQALQI